MFEYVDQYKIRRVVEPKKEFSWVDSGRLNFVFARATLDRLKMLGSKEVVSYLGWLRRVYVFH